MKKRGLSNEMNKYVNVLFRYDNVLMYYIVYKFVMFEVYFFFLFD